MKFDFVKNVQFTKLIKVNGQLKEFNFRKANNSDEGTFSVDVSDDRGNRIMLQMQKEGGHWKIVTPGIPKWVAEKEEEFNMAINEQ